MKIGHLEIKLTDLILDEENSSILRKVTSGKFNQLSEIRTSENWHETKDSLIKEFNCLIAQNQADHPICMPIRSLLFLLHNWNPSEWKNYLNICYSNDRLCDLWLIPCDELHKKLMDQFSIVALDI